MKKYHIPIMLAVFAVLCSALSPASCLAGEKLRIVMENEYLPFIYNNDQGEPDGFNVDVAKAVCHELGVEFEIVRHPWGEIMTRISKGEYDLAVANMFRTPEREKIVDFVGPYLRTKSGFVGRTGFPDDLSPAVIKDKVMCAQKGSKQVDFLKKKYAGLTTIRETDTMGSALVGLTNGECDLVFTSLLNSYQFLNSEKGKDFDLIGEFLPSKDYPYTDAHMIVQKGNHELRDKVNAALIKLRSSGEYSKLSKKYFPFTVF